PPAAARSATARAEIVDAVPQGGEVRFVRRDDADEAGIGTLLDGAAAEPVAPRLEDGFMTLLRAQEEPAQKPAEPIARQPAPSSSTPGDTVIEVKDLVRRFGDFTAVASTSFSVRRGEIFGLLGPNGAGKTTTFRMLCGLLPASGGQLRVAGVDLR
ncbi:ATP-binding cassette domain-containing protein, partial [Variovorax sp. CT11-76]